MALATVSGTEAHYAVVRTSAVMHANASSPPMAINIERGARMQARTNAAGELAPTTFTPRLFCVLLSALSKIAARSPDLIPRVLLCFGKLVKVTVVRRLMARTSRISDQANAAVIVLLLTVRRSNNKSLVSTALWSSAPTSSRACYACRGTTDGNTAQMTSKRI